MILKKGVTERRKKLFNIKIYRLIILCFEALYFFR